MINSLLSRHGFDDATGNTDLFSRKVFTFSVMLLLMALAFHAQKDPDGSA